MNNADIRKLIVKILFALLSGWLLFLVGLAGVYTHQLTHPACPPDATEHPGYTPVQVSVSPKLALPGWWRAPQNGAVILLLGGSGSNAASILPTADLLAQEGYGILTLASRNCAGQPVTLGYREAEDVQAMLTFARSQPGVDWVGALGFSAGGAAVLRAAAREPGLQAVIAEGQYSNLRHEVINDPARPLSLQWQFHRAVLFTLWLQIGVQPAHLSPLDDLRQLGQPVLLIHGEREAANNQASEQCLAANSPKTCWVVPGAGHGDYQQVQPEEYKQRVLQFFDQARRP